MNKKHIEDQIFKEIDFSDQPLERAVYSYCAFQHCKLGDLAFVEFVECSFEDCDFGGANLDNTSFREVFFKGCKMQGLYFDHCKDFMLSFQFETCILNYSTFSQLKIKGTEFRKCQMKEVDFIETDLTKAIFDHCDLKQANFERAILEQADFRTAQNYIIDPELNRIRKAYFSRDGIDGLLKKYRIIIE